MRVDMWDRHVYRHVYKQIYKHANLDMCIRAAVAEIWALLCILVFTALLVSHFLGPGVFTGSRRVPAAQQQRQATTFA